jgi:hypothetical protein
MLNVDNTRLMLGFVMLGVVMLNVGVPFVIVKQPSLISEGKTVGLHTVRKLAILTSLD